MSKIDRKIMAMVCCLSFALTFATACKTNDEASDFSSWKIDGSVEKAESFIIDTVVGTYPKVDRKNRELKRFVEALMNRTTEHSENQDFVLTARAAQGHAALQRYIITEFATSTNIFEILESDMELKYLGPADQSYEP